MTNQTLKKRVAYSKKQNNEHVKKSRSLSKQNKRNFQRLLTNLFLIGSCGLFIEFLRTLKEENKLATYEPFNFEGYMWDSVEVDPFNPQCDGRMDPVANAAIAKYSPEIPVLIEGKHSLESYKKYSNNNGKWDKHIMVMLYPTLCVTQIQDYQLSYFPSSTTSYQVYDLYMDCFVVCGQKSAIEKDKLLNPEQYKLQFSNVNHKEINIKNSAIKAIFDSSFQISYNTIGQDLVSISVYLIFYLKEENLKLDVDSMRYLIDNDYRKFFEAFISHFSDIDVSNYDSNLLAKTSYRYYSGVGNDILFLFPFVPDRKYLEGENPTLIKYYKLWTKKNIQKTLNLIFKSQRARLLDPNHDDWNTSFERLIYIMEKGYNNMYSIPFLEDILRFGFLEHYKLMTDACLSSTGLSFFPHSLFSDKVALKCFELKQFKTIFRKWYPLLSPAIQDIVENDPLLAQLAGNKHSNEMLSNLSKTDENGWSGLHEMIQAGNLPAIRRIKQQGLDVKQCIINGACPLNLLIQSKHRDKLDPPIYTYADEDTMNNIFILLLESYDPGNDIDYLLTVMNEAIAYSDVYIINSLIQFGVHFNLDSAKAVLDSLSEFSPSEQLKQMIHHQDKNGFSLIYFAIYHGHSASIIKLIELGVDTTQQLVFNNKTPLQYFIECYSKNDLDIFKQLFFYGRPKLITANIKDLINDSINYKCNDILKFLVKQVVKNHKDHNE